MIDAAAAAPRRFTIQGWRVERYDVLDSTSEEARRRALAGDPGKLWILADRQTAGRGRHGRDWRSPLGNFHGSALLIAPCDVAFAPQIGFVAGVALHAAVGDLGARDVKLKWPNDLVAGGAKLAGILLEGWSYGGRAVRRRGRDRRQSRHRIPTICLIPPTHLERNDRPARSRCASVSSGSRNASTRRSTVFARGQGFAAIRARNGSQRRRGSASPCGRPRPRACARALFEGLDARGRLLLRGARRDRDDRIR